MLRNASLIWLAFRGLALAIHESFDDEEGFLP